jgi:hypothetical protein
MLQHLLVVMGVLVQLQVFLDHLLLMRAVVGGLALILQASEEQEVAEMVVVVRPRLVEPRVQLIQEEAAAAVSQVVLVVLVAQVS